MAIKKRIPNDEEGFDLMLQNMNAKCAGYSVELNISNAQLTTLGTNATSYHECRLLKDQINDTKTSYTSFVKIIFSGDKKDPLPPTPNLTFNVPTLPAKPGIEKQTKEFIVYLESQDNFTDAIGLDLGFYEEVSDSSPENLIGDFKVKDALDYQLIISFSLQGQDALRLSWRVKGTTAWTNITLTSSPYTLEVEADPNGLAVTLEMQAVLIKNNKPIGNTSDLKTVIARA